ncbi:MAG TPA: hypothetical protein VJ719_11450, partial [Chthoniobacterales bacterium]|nr:hypothetical protein [Chthoniobacterales bacterium]
CQAYKVGSYLAGASGQGRGISYAAFTGIMILVAVIAGIAGALALVLHQLRKAPIGYEDEHGFHAVRQIHGSAILRNRKAQDVPAGSLKGARAHS